MKNRKLRKIFSAFTDNEITSEEFFWQRRRFIKNLGASSLGASILGSNIINASATKKVPAEFQSTEPLSSEHVVTHHNNFYEFSTSKSEPAILAKDFNPGNDWKITVSGEVENAGDYHLDDLLKRVDIEERIYRLRCVEAWSMVIPWRGFQLSQLINLLKPTSKAKYVEFKTLHSPDVFPGQKRGTLGFHSLPWPYSEGLRLDEAMNPLTFIATGVYGKDLPGQNGTPFRLVVPWKYGFKSIKSIVSIRFLENQPMSTWQDRAAKEYGFYANVNPNVDHPRWSQAKERRITDDSFFGTKKIPTQMFNGYSEQVAHLYKGLDLVRNF